MIEHNQAVVESNVAVGQFQVVHRAAREFRLGEIFQVVAPITKAPPSGNGESISSSSSKRAMSASSRCHGLPNWSWQLGVGSWEWGDNFTARAEGTENQKRIRRDKGIPRRRRIKRIAPQQNNPRSAIRNPQLPDERFGRVRGRDFLDQRAHGLFSSAYGAVSSKWTSSCGCERCTLWSPSMMIIGQPRALARW